MRDLKECQAEVFRRSEKRIKARKQRRNHMLAACVPLALCGILFSTLGKPVTLPEGTKEPYGTVPAMGDWKEENTYSYAFSSVAQIDISGANLSLSHTEPNKVQLISEQLYSYDTRGPETNGTSNDGVADEGEDCKENADDVSSSIADSANTGYTITLVMHEGEKTEYYLAGNTLKNLNTNQTYTLSQTQVNELKDMLGIPHQ